MLEDHSPTNRSGSRKPFRRKGGKSVLFNTSCIYYQIEPVDDSSDGEDEDVDQEDLITDSQLEEVDPLETESKPSEDEQSRTVQRLKPEVVVEDIDFEPDQPHPSPRIDGESVDVGTSTIKLISNLRIRLRRTQDHANQGS